MNIKSKKSTLSLLTAFNILAMINTMAQTPKGQNLLPNGLSSFSLQGAASLNAIVEETTVSRQAFSKAFSINSCHTKLGVNTIALVANILLRPCTRAMFYGSHLNPVVWKANVKQEKHRLNFVLTS